MGIDVDNYNDANIDIIIDIYENIKEKLVPKDKKHLTLVTKVLLGIFGFVPAYDTYFCNSFRTMYKGKSNFRKLDKESLCCIKSFYDNNNVVINNLSSKICTIKFSTGDPTTTITYPKAKIIDMYGFTLGQPTTKTP